MRNRHIALRSALAALLLVFTLATHTHVVQAAPDHTPVLPPCPTTLVQRATAAIVRLFIDPFANCYEQRFSLIGLVRIKVQASFAQSWATVMDAIWVQMRTLCNKC
jgi:hypothetical protein